MIGDNNFNLSQHKVKYVNGLVCISFILEINEFIVIHGVA